MKKILIVQASYYHDISKMLLDGALAEIEKQGVKYEVIDVPGALEIPAAISLARKTKEYAGFIALGCVIRGETSHYDIVANESTHGLMKLSLKGVAIGNGIITTENKEQAIARANIAQKNKGGFAALTCLKMIEIKEGFCDKIPKKSRKNFSRDITKFFLQNDEK